MGVISQTKPEPKSGLSPISSSKKSCYCTLTIISNSHSSPVRPEQEHPPSSSRFHSRAPLQGDVESPKEPSPTRSHLCCEGLGHSVMPQPLPLSLERAEPCQPCSPCGTCPSVRGPLSPSSPPPLQAMNTGQYLSANTHACVFSAGTGRGGCEEGAEHSLAQPLSSAPLRVLPAPHAVAQD